MKKTILTNLLISTLLLLSYASETPGKNNNKSNTEITDTDITLFNQITAKDISVFGISLSMSIDEVNKTIADHPHVYLEKDAFNPDRSYIYEKERSGNSKPKTLAYLIWDKEKNKLSEITLYQGITKYLVGETRKLLTYDVIIRDSYIVKFYMGYPSKQEIILDIPTINMRSTAFYYPHKNFKVIKNVSNYMVSFTLSLMLDPGI